jgi:hypothetical protein
MIRDFIPMRWLGISPKESIAVVGNGSVSKLQGRKIDRFSFVVRFNRFQNYGISGLKTDAVVFVPTGDSGRLNASLQNHCGAIDRASQFWISKSPEIIAEQNKEPIPDGEDDGFRRDWTKEIRANHVRERPMLCFDTSIYYDAMIRLRNSGAKNFLEPSTGLLTILYLRKHFDLPIVLFGFTHEGWYGHPWEAERKLISSLPNCRHYQATRGSDQDQALEPIGVNP